MESINDYLVVQKEVIEEERSAGGIIMNVSSVFDFGDKFSKKNVCKATVAFANPSIPFLKSGDKIVFNPNRGKRINMDWNDLHVITSDQFIAKIDADGKYIVPKDCVMVKIQKEDRDKLFVKTIIRNDGTTTQLFLQPEAHKDTVQRSKVFVSSGVIVQVGSDVVGLEENDIAVLDYVVDNEIDNVLYFDDDGSKYVVLTAETLLHKYDVWAYATRQFPKDNLVSKKNDIEVISPILGVVRNCKLIARSPYCFLEHQSNIVEKSKFGIVYTEEQEVVERKVLSVNDAGKVKFGIKEGQVVIVKDEDIFDVQIGENKVQAVYDFDVMMGKL